MTTTRSYMLAVLVAAGLHGPVTAVAACPARPLAACRAAGSASLAIDDRADAPFDGSE